MLHTAKLHERGFKADSLEQQDLQKLQEHARLSRGDILKMTTLAGCGHPGGSLSSIDMYLTLYAEASVFPDDPGHPDRGQQRPGLPRFDAQPDGVNRERCDLQLERPEWIQFHATESFD